MNNEYKQIIVIRSDLKMGKGKIAAQVAHGAVIASEKARISHKKLYLNWVKNGQPKIILKTDSLKSLLEIKRRAESKGLLTALIEDRGLTQIPEGTITCLCIGPASSSIIDEITRKLKLL